MLDARTSVMINAKYPLFITARRNVIKSEFVQLQKTTWTEVPQVMISSTFSKLYSQRYRPYHINNAWNWDCQQYAFDESRRTPHNVNFPCWGLVHRQCPDRRLSETDSKKFVDFPKYTKAMSFNNHWECNQGYTSFDVTRIEGTQYHELCRNWSSCCGLCFRGYEDCISWLLKCGS
jgi:hypothetical protein